MKHAPLVVSLFALVLGFVALADAQVAWKNSIFACQVIFETRDAIIATQASVSSLASAEISVSDHALWIQGHACFPCWECKGAGFRMPVEGVDGHEETALRSADGRAVWSLYPEADLRCPRCLGRGWLSLIAPVASSSR